MPPGPPNAIVGCDPLENACWSFAETRQVRARVIVCWVTVLAHEPDTQSWTWTVKLKVPCRAGEPLKPPADVSATPGGSTPLMTVAATVPLPPTIVRPGSASNTTPSRSVVEAVRFVMFSDPVNCVTHCENSDVFPAASVAVAVMKLPAPGANANG